MGKSVRRSGRKEESEVEAGQLHGVAGVVLEARAEQSSIVVLTDTWLPGWEATVDGVPVQLFRANGLYRAVAVGPGVHKVVFSYHAPGLDRGIGLSTAALLLLVATPLVARRLTGMKSGR